MITTFYCTSCQAHLSGNPGVKVTCPKCGQRLLVPSARDNKTTLGSLSSLEQIVETKIAEPPAYLPPQPQVVFVNNPPTVEPNSGFPAGTWLACASLICTFLSGLCWVVPLFVLGSIFVAFVGLALGFLSLILAMKAETEYATPTIAFFFGLIAFAVNAFFVLWFWSTIFTAFNPNHRPR